MNTKVTVSAALILFGSCGLAAAMAQPLEGSKLDRRADLKASQPEHRFDKARRDGHRMGKAAFMERFDTDGNGELSEGEKAGAKETLQAEREAKRAEVKARLLARFDDNGNGELDENERAEIREIMGSLMRERSRRGGERRGELRKKAHERFDANGDGELNEAEKANAKAFFEQRKAELVARFDADGDGELSGTEREAAGQHMREKRALDANRDGIVDAIDAQVITERAAAGQPIPDINRDGNQDAADVAELIRRIGSFNDVEG